MSSRVSRTLSAVLAAASAVPTLASASTQAPPVVTSTRIARPAPQPENCPPFAPIGSERLLLYGTHDGAALSSVAVGDRNVETTVANVHIERGRERLYIILSSTDSIIWRFTGDVARVSKLYVSTREKLLSGNPAAGVTGVDRKKVTFGHCLRSLQAAESIEAARSRGDIRKALGRDPDFVGGTYETARVSLPSGSALPAPAVQRQLPANFDERLWRDEVLRFWPAGLARMSAQSVISPEQAIVYDVLPSQGGLAQLAGSGALKRIPNNSFKIMRPIARFPAGMGGAHSTRFLLGTGVPMPEGDPVHSCVVDEKTGDVLSSQISCGQ